MNVELFAGIGVTDHAVAAEWYERLLGGPASFRPHETESVWTLTEGAHVYVVQEPRHAGHALVTVFVPDLAGFVRSAHERGVDPVGEERYDEGVRKILFRDPDGNRVGIGGAFS